jgi:hypothetical protein
MHNELTVLVIQPAKSISISKIPLGIYRIKWKSGRSSIAAIGQSESGDRWIAPCNWAEPDLKPNWTAVVSIELIESV